jgi:hypothetical protein
MIPDLIYRSTKPSHLRTILNKVMLLSINACYIELWELFKLQWKLIKSTSSHLRTNHIIWQHKTIILIKSEPKERLIYTKTNMQFSHHCYKLEVQINEMENVWTWYEDLGMDLKLHRSPIQLMHSSSCSWSRLVSFE